MSRVSELANQAINRLAGNYGQNTEVVHIEMQEIENIVSRVLRQSDIETYQAKLPMILDSYVPGMYKEMQPDTLAWIWTAIHAVGNAHLPFGQQQFDELKAAIEKYIPEPYKWPERKRVDPRYTIPTNKPRDTFTKAQATPPNVIHKAMTPQKANERRKLYQQKLEAEKQLKKKSLEDWERKRLTKVVQKIEDQLEDSHIKMARGIIAQCDAEIEYQIALRGIYADILDRKQAELEQPIEKIKREWDSLLNRIGLLKDKYFAANKGKLGSLNWPPESTRDFDHLVNVFGEEVLLKFQNSELPEKYQRSEAEEEKLSWIE